MGQTANLRQEQSYAGSNPALSANQEGTQMVASGLENRGVLKPTEFDSLAFRQFKKKG